MQRAASTAFTRHTRDQLSGTDITEHPTFAGKVYCAVVLDTFSRRVVGWSIDASPTATLTANALAITGYRYSSYHRWI